MKELGTLVEIEEISRKDHVQVIKLKFSGGESYVQERKWPAIMKSADDGAESLLSMLYWNDAFIKLLKDDVDVAYVVISLCSELISGKDLKESIVATEAFKNGKVNIQSQEVFNFDWFEVIKMHCSHSLWRGGESESKEHIFVKGRQGVSCVLYDPKIDSVVLIEEFRIGAINETTAWMIGIPTGGLEDGEEPAVGAARECKEEAGVDVLNIQHMLTYKPSPGFTTHDVHLFYAECDTSLIQSRINGLEEEAEDIKISIVSIDQLYFMVKNGDITNGCAIVALMHFMAFHYDTVKLAQ